MHNSAHSVTASPGLPPAPELLYKAGQLMGTRWSTLRYGVFKERLGQKLTYRVHWVDLGLSACYQLSLRSSSITLTPTGRRSTCYCLEIGRRGVVDLGTTVYLGEGDVQRLASMWDS